MYFAFALTTKVYMYYLSCNQQRIEIDGSLALL